MTKEAKRRREVPNLGSVWTSSAPSVQVASVAPKHPILHISPVRRRPAFLEGGPQTEPVARPKIHVPAPRPANLPAITTMMGRNRQMIDAADSVTERGQVGMRKAMAIASKWGVDTSHLPKKAYFAANARSMMASPTVKASAPSNVLSMSSYHPRSISVGGPSVLTESFGALVLPFRSPLRGTGLSRRPSPVATYAAPKPRWAA